MSSNSDGSFYGRGSDIWPPTNQGEPITLQDSFPGKLIPDSVVETLQSSSTMTSSSSSSSYQSTSPSTTTTTATTRPKNWLDRVPSILLVGLIPWIRPLDVGLVLSSTIYTAALTLAAASLRGNTETNFLSTTTTRTTNNNAAPTLPHLPPQGHVPVMVQNPLLDLTYSWGYDIWWRSGILLGFIAPLLTMTYAGIVHPSLDSTATASGTTTSLILSFLARPLWLLACQATSELMAKDALLPLPIRIWIPISYQLMRLVYLGWGFFQVTTVLAANSTPFFGWIQTWSLLSLAYTILNIFGFLLPVALIRYMRAHFFAVEAASVTLHPGMEETVGLTPTPTDWTTASLDD